MAVSRGGITSGSDVFVLLRDTHVSLRYLERTVCRAFIRSVTRKKGPAITALLDKPAVAPSECELGGALPTGLPTLRLLSP